MRRIKSSISVQAPCAFTLSSLNTYLRDSEDLRLRVPIQPFGNALALETAVTVDVEYAHHELAIRWMPQGEAAFPCFDGTITAKDDGNEGCALTLAGAYDPLGGLAGVVFDEFAGRRIALSTLDELLHELRVAIEADYMLRTRS
ncbi:MAG: hypothetical protein NVSMB64_12440 [Candidatus Velthaea sp.]